MINPMSRKHHTGYFVQGQFVRRGSPAELALSVGAAPSKTQLKKASEARQQLGEKLAALTPTAWAKLDLPQTLVDALQDCQAITARAARRRQYQLIGKLMHLVDVDALRAQMQQHLLLPKPK